MSTLDQLIAKSEETKWWEVRKRSQLNTTILQAIWDNVEVLVDAAKKEAASKPVEPEYRESDTHSQNHISGQDNVVGASGSNWATETEARMGFTPNARSTK